MLQFDTDDNDYIEKLCEIGGKIYVVGGAIRNYLYNCFNKTNKMSKDFDFLVCDLEQNQIIDILSKFGKVKEVGSAFGIILFTHILNNGTYENIEFALPRTEISTGSGYKDFVIKPDPKLEIEEDFSRRDSTINAIGFQIYNLKDIELIDHIKNPEPDLSKFKDPFNGISDIKNKIWRAIGDPYKRFLEDPTRIMRAFRQSCELELVIEENTLKAISEHYNVMKSLIPGSYVRLFNELLKIMKVKNSGKTLKKMNELEILKFLGIETEITNLCVKKINESEFIIKFALILNPENKQKSIKMWINERQILATLCFTQLDLHILESIESFTIDICNLFEKETLIDTITYKLLQIREKIYKYSKNNSTYVLEKLLTYVKTKYMIDINIDFLLKKFDQYIMSTDQLVISGDILQEKWNIKGKQIAKIKMMILDNIFMNKLMNTKEDIIQYVNKTYLLLE